VIGEHGDGTNAELIAVPATNVHPIPDGLSFEEAAATVTAAVAVRATSRSDYRAVAGLTLNL